MSDKPIWFGKSNPLYISNDSFSEEEVLREGGITLNNYAKHLLNDPNNELDFYFIQINVNTKIPDEKEVSKLELNLYFDQKKTSDNEKAKVHSTSPAIKWLEKKIKESESGMELNTNLEGDINLQTPVEIIKYFLREDLIGVSAKANINGKLYNQLKISKRKTSKSGHLVIAASGTNSPIFHWKLENSETKDKPVFDFYVIFKVPKGIQEIYLNADVDISTKHKKWLKSFLQWFRFSKQSKEVEKYEYSQEWPIKLPKPKKKEEYEREISSSDMDYPTPSEDLNLSLCVRQIYEFAKNGELCCLFSNNVIQLKDYLQKYKYSKEVNIEFYQQSQFNEATSKLFLKVRRELDLTESKIIFIIDCSENSLEEKQRLFYEIQDLYEARNNDQQYQRFSAIVLDQFNKDKSLCIGWHVKWESNDIPTLVYQGVDKDTQQLLEELIRKQTEVDFISFYENSRNILG